MKRLHKLLGLLLALAVFVSTPVSALAQTEGVAEIVAELVKYREGVRSIQFNSMGTDPKTQICEVTVELDQNVEEAYTVFERLLELGFIPNAVTLDAGREIYSRNFPGPCPPPPAVEGWEIGKVKGMDYPGYYRPELYALSEPSTEPIPWALLGLLLFELASLLFIGLFFWRRIQRNRAVGGGV
ncbi:MAG: hypothetical protein AAB443_02720 [Patescibacteria group bacterium]